MPAPTKIAITDRGFIISMTQAQQAALPTVRLVDPAIGVYGLPTTGRQLVHLVAGDVITDASTITSILGVTTDTADYPQGWLPAYTDAH